MLQILVIVFGVMSAFRALARLRSHSFIGADEWPKLSLIIFLGSGIVMITALFLPKTAMALCCVHVFFSYKLAGLLFRYRLARFEQQKTIFVSHLLLKMKSGRSLRTAFNEILVDLRIQKSPFVSLLQPVYDSVMLGQLSPALSDCLSLQELARELMCADQSSHHMLTRVANLRTLYQKRFDFRRRSGQVLTQIHAQAMLLVGLYLALSIFTALQYGWEKFLALRLMSALLFALGLIMIFYLGKKIRWKV